MSHTISHGDAAAQESNQNEDEKILKDAKARFDLAVEAESEIRRLALEDIEFSAGAQWPENIRQDRDRDGRPCLIINKIPQFIQQITNDQRQNRPSIKVHPVDGTGDVETGKTIQGMIRHIEYNSNADVAYDTAFDGAVRGGFGYWRIVTEYTSPMGFDQEIKIKRIRNPFSVYLDPHSQEPDGSDASWGFIIEDVARAEYSSLYGKSKLAGIDGWDSLGHEAPSWKSGDSCRIAEYFYKEFEEKEICLLDTGEIVLKSEVDQVIQIKAQNGIAASVVKERTARVPVVKWCKLNGIEILDKTEWLGQYIPIVPVYGQELDINGKRVLEGIVRNAKDPARMYNYWKSAETEAIALAPRAPFILAEGQVEGHEEMWSTANRRNHSYLTYKAVSVGGTPIGPPQRNSFEPAIGAITQASMGAADDLKATTGIYDASLGGRSNETSGVAIQRRNQQAQTSNFHFVDNLTRSMKHTGRILADLIPKIYDTARAQRIIGEDGEQKIVQVNEPFEENGKPVLYQLDSGKYDVTMDVGPSYASKRQEAAASMLELSKAAPQLMQVAGDIMVKNMDWPGAHDIAERLKKTLPPGLADDPKDKKEIPPQVQAQMQQMNQLIEQLTGKLNEAQDAIAHKRVELESKERIEFAKLETQATIELAKLESKEALNMLSQQIAELDQRTQMLGMNEPMYQGDEQEQEFSPEPDGGMTADQGLGMEDPTGGASPGQPLEGNFE